MHNLLFCFYAGPTTRVEGKLPDRWRSGNKEAERGGEGQHCALCV